MPLTKKQELALKLLKGAKKHLRKDGWHQGSYQDSTTYWDRPGRPCCLIGAMNRALWDMEPESVRNHFETAWELDKKRVYTAAFGSKKERMKRLGTDEVPLWNDESGRTEKEVIAYLDERIAILEAKA